MQRNGLPPGFFRQVSDRPIEDMTCDPHAPSEVLPYMEQFGQALAYALKQFRPVVTLPPQNFLPYKGQPFFVEDRCTLIPRGNTSAAIGTATTTAAAAEHVRAITEVSSAPKTLASYKVPKGTIAVIRQWIGQPDELGYDLIDVTNGIAAVQIVLRINGQPIIWPNSPRGLSGSLDVPYEVGFVAPEDSVISVTAVNNDTATFHFIDSYIQGYVIPSNHIAEMFDSLLEGNPQPGPRINQ